MEDRIQEHEMGVHEGEDSLADQIRPEHVRTLMIVKIRAFGEMIKETKAKTVEKFNARKESSSNEDKPKDISMLEEEEEKKESAQETVAVEVEESKDESQPV